MGLFALDSVDELVTAQEVIKTWAGGACIDLQDMEMLDDAQEIDILVAGPAETDLLHLFQDNDTAPELTSRAECNVIQVVEGDSCASLATRCGITVTQFNNFNSNENLCSTLAPKQWVCCSSGTMPAMTPQPQADGTCAIYEVMAGDGRLPRSRRLSPSLKVYHLWICLKRYCITTQFRGP